MSWNQREQQTRPSSLPRKAGGGWSREADRVGARDSTLTPHPPRFARLPSPYGGGMQ